MEEIIIDAIIIVALVLIAYAIILWLFIYTAVKHGVKKAIEEVLPNISIIDEEEDY